MKNSEFILNGRHIESTILNFSFSRRNSNKRPQKPPYIHFCAIWMKNVEFDKKSAIFNF